jgi:hypothetical protein
MLPQSDILLESTVSFDLYPAHALGTSIKNAKVLGIFNAQTAMQLGFDAPALHAIVFPTLPPGTPNGADKYQYVYLKLTNGTKTFIGIPWIKESTYVVEMVRTVALYIENISPDQQNQAILALSAIGLTVAKTEIIEGTP